MNVIFLVNIILDLKQQLDIDILLMLCGYFCMYVFIGGVVKSGRISGEYVVCIRKG